MPGRAEQREATRARIIDAALESMASQPAFGGVSTRAIAERAGVSQGLLSYHFKSKDALWRASARRLFSLNDETVLNALRAFDPDDPRGSQRELIRQVVRFFAAHPALLRIAMEAGSACDGRSEWLVETFVRPRYNEFTQFMGHIDPEDLPHAFYTFVGACGAIFCLPGECVVATGVDPRTSVAIERHASFVAKLLVPERRKKAAPKA